MEVAVILAAGRFIGPIVLKNIGVIATFIGVQALHASQDDHWLRLQEDVAVVSSVVKQVEQHVADLRVAGFNNRDIFDPINSALKAIERRLCKAGKVFQQQGYQTTDPTEVRDQCTELIELTSPLSVLLQILEQKTQSQRAKVLAAKGKSLFSVGSLEGGAGQSCWTKPDSIALVGQLSASLLREGMGTVVVSKAVEGYLDRKMTSREMEVLQALEADLRAKSTVVVYVKCARNLRRADLFSQSDPFVTVSVISLENFELQAGAEANDALDAIFSVQKHKPQNKVEAAAANQTQKTKIVKNNCNPEWEQQFTFKGVRLSDALRFCCFDYDLGCTNGDPLGSLDLQVGSLVQASLGKDSPAPSYSLQGRGAGVGQLSVGAVLKESQAFHVVLTVVEGIGLRSADFMSESDPYVMVEYTPRQHESVFDEKLHNGQISKREYDQLVAADQRARRESGQAVAPAAEVVKNARSPAKENTANPGWDFDVLLPGHDPQALVVLSVFDQDDGRLRSDDPLGSISLRVGSLLGMVGGESMVLPLDGQGAGKGQLRLRCDRL
jgi:hypothetical protein